MLVIVFLEVTVEFAYMNKQTIGLQGCKNVVEVRRGNKRPSRMESKIQTRHFAVAFFYF
jgi:hypothetical protein